MPETPLTPPGSRRLAAALLALGFPLLPALAQRPATPPTPSVQLPLAPTAEPAPAPGHSLLEQPPVPATVRLEAGKLSVTAANASLAQTLRDISSATGTAIDGISKDQRVFGVYGPGTPQEVLTALLDDSGYNVLMVGRLASGAPRSLVLSPRTASSPGSANTAQNTRNIPAEDDDDEPAGVPQPPPSNPAPLFGGAGQGAAPVAQPGAATAQPTQVKTPQQMLEELQQLHRQQESGQQGTQGQGFPQAPLQNSPQ